MSFLAKVRSFSLKKAGYFSVAVGVINLIIHTLLMLGILPYTWINGGRSESFEAAFQTSLMSIIITVISLFISMIASGIIPVKFNRFWGIALSVFLIATLPLDFIGIVQQFLGTLFEKCFCSILTITAFLADFRIAFEKRWPEKA